MPVVRVTWFEGKDTPTKQKVAAEITVSRRASRLDADVIGVRGNNQEQAFAGRH